ncbi:hypothetical protein GH865_06125 [Rhodocyclus tenuis]|uniref:hypothetical protein n=1 Tax=Rhodocyclus gracilis TaxID=2929842 RepID=UPI001298BF04|nr:hypothetical protein [Rhodocyclus gracilis]MRD72829.1 hypothetical protein [Rhodocyclus gracilis]
MLHCCPVCGRWHAIPAILHRLSYGRAQPCSPRCKARFPELARARVLAEMAAARARLGPDEAANDAVMPTEPDTFRTSKV